MLRERFRSVRWHFTLSLRDSNLKVNHKIIIENLKEIRSSTVLYHKIGINNVIYWVVESINAFEHLNNFIKHTKQTQNIQLPYSKSFPEHKRWYAEESRRIPKWRGRWHQGTDINDVSGNYKANAFATRNVSREATKQYTDRQVSILYGEFN